MVPAAPLLMLVWCDRTSLSPENPRWVGAWWIGFLLGGAAALLVAIPILGYPRQLPGTAPVDCRHTHTVIMKLCERRPLLGGLC